jgi:putative sigma-54 modulation protein
MKIDITGRHIDLTPALQEFAQDKLKKLEKLLQEPIEAHVVLSIVKHRHIAEVQVKSRTVAFSGTEETGDLYASIGEVVDKLERQALKHKEKVHDHKHRRGPRDPEVAAAIGEAAAPETHVEPTEIEPEN